MKARGVMKRKVKNISTIVLVTIVLIAAVYVLLGIYYMEGFPCFTWINGVYATGKTVQEVNDELAGKYTYSGIKVIDATGAELNISATDVDLKVDYTDALNGVLSHQNPFLWGVNLFKNLSFHYEPTVQINRDKLYEKLSNWEIFTEQKELSVRIDKTEQGYVLVNEKDRVPNLDNIIGVVYDGMHNLSESVDLSSNETCYQSLELTKEEKDLVTFFKKIEKLQNCQIVYSIENELIPVDAAVVSDWILRSEDLEEALSEKISKKSPGSGLFIIRHQESKLPKEEELSEYDGFVIDSQGSLIVSEKKIYEFLFGLSQKYGTAWTMKRYRNGESSEVVINKNSKGDGSLFDVDKEFENLKTAFIEESYAINTQINLEIQESCLVIDAASQLGQTYIEVNMGDQMLYYYENGELVMDMPVVTGNVNRSRGTPTGLFSVYNKRYHTYLRGVDYVSYVNYWLGVNKGVGIHDALWRNKFGDEIYKSDGSHGCINCPMEKVSRLWEIVEIGTPVILYY